MPASNPDIMLKPTGKRRTRLPLGDRLKCEMYDSPLRWLVESESMEGEVHLVDLQTWTCSCTDYSTRKGPELKKGVSKRECSCKHIRKSLQEFSWLMLEETIKVAVERDKLNKKSLVVDEE